MNSPNQNPAPKPPRRLWPWVLAGVLCAPFVVLGTAAVSYLTLDREAALIRREVMRASDTGWKTRVQFSAGPASFATVRGGLSFVRHREADEARAALRAVRRASVGVYEARGDAGDWTGSELLDRVDRRMGDRGWTRVVGVVDRGSTVLVYVPANCESLDEVCVAVLDGRQLVVVSAELRPDDVLAFVERHAGELNLGRRVRGRL
ncbi:MAG TPA: hypothetical protein VEB66_16015 [Opitutaceae bacterium]|nr:hypothetical protein [Opitutaceae bacterium]